VVRRPRLDSSQGVAVHVLSPSRLPARHHRTVRAQSPWTYFQIRVLSVDRNARAPPSIFFEK
jgi:hypothetical protein